MKRMLKVSLAGLLVLGTLIMGFAAVSAQRSEVIGNEAKPIKGSGSSKDPYVYLIDEDTKITWKHLETDKEAKISEAYEMRTGKKETGELKYRWDFREGDITKAEGPYFLGIRFYKGEAVKALPWGTKCKYFSFATKRDFPGKVTISLSVKDEFKKGSFLNLYYYGGYDAAVVHSSEPIIAQDEILKRDDDFKQMAKELKVEDGMVSFEIWHGGNYFLTDSIPKNILQKSSLETVEHEPNKVLGTIKSLFHDEGIKRAAAEYFDKAESAVLKQGDLDNIKRLYLARLNLNSTKELEAFAFGKLESLTLSENKLTELGKLTMPCLTDLDLSYNRLSTAGEIKGLDKLENLNLEGNKLIALPDFSNLSKLKTLNLSKNQLNVLPPIRSDNLIYLNVEGNHLAKMPDLSQCPNLKEIELTNQKLEVNSSIKERMSFKINPAPEIIEQYGQGVGDVKLYDHNKKLIYEESYKELREDDFKIAALYLKPGDCTLVITGYYGINQLEAAAGARCLGTYTYHIRVERNWTYYIIIGIVSGILGVTALGVQVRKLLQKRGIQND